MAASRFFCRVVMRRTGISLLLAAAVAGCTALPSPRSGAADRIPADLAARHDFSLADTPNKRTALAYLYMAWNDGRLREARQSFWLPGSFPQGGGSSPPPPHPRFTIKQVIEEGDKVVVLAFVEGAGIGSRITTIFGTDGGIKIGDAVVEIFQFDESGLIKAKWDTIQPLSEESYDFR